MNEEEAKKIIDNMSEQELNNFIFFALKEVEKENQKLKTELEKKEEWINKLETKLMYALTPTKHELADKTKEAFKNIIKKNINEDTYTIRNEIVRYWYGRTKK